MITRHPYMRARPHGSGSGDGYGDDSGDGYGKTRRYIDTTDPHTTQETQT